MSQSKVQNIYLVKFISKTAVYMNSKNNTIFFLNAKLGNN